MIRFKWAFAMWLSAALAICSASRVAADESKSDVEEKVQQLMHNAADFVQRQNSLRAEVQADIKIHAGEIKQDVSTTYTLAVARPNRISLRARKGDDGVTVVSDGKQFARAVGPLKKYVVSDSPASVAEVFSDQAVMMVGLGMGGPFLHALFSDDVYKNLLEGVTLARVVGVDKVDDHNCRHLHFEQADYDWDLWIDDGAEPLMRRITFDPMKRVDAQDNQQFKDMKMSVSFVFGSWDLKPTLADDEFAFTPPDGYEKVESLFGGEVDEEPHPLLGQPAPPFTLDRLAGGKADLARHRDKDVVILDFWATWCGPCRAALPTLVKVAKKYRDKGVVFYAIDLKEEADDVNKFIAEQKLELPVILDRDGEVSKLYKVEGIPQTVLVGKDGTVQVVHVGLLGDLETRLSKELDDLLAGKDLAAIAREAAVGKDDEPGEGLELVWSRNGTWTGIATTEDGALYSVGPGGQMVKLNVQGEEIAVRKLQDRPAFIRAANLAGDKEPELMTFTIWGPTVKAHTVGGDLLWSYAKGQGVDDVWTADLTGDGLDEVIVGYNGSTGLHVLDNTGNLLWSNTKLGNVWHVTSGNVDGDARPEVVTTSAAGKVHIFSAEGKHVRDVDPGLYGHMVRTWHNRNDENALDIIVVAGTDRPKERVVGLSGTGQQRWNLEIPARVESAATCGQKPWLAIALADRSVRVVEVLTGNEIAKVPGQGPRCDVGWLPVKDNDPLLVVSTGSALRAYRVDRAKKD